MSVLDQKITAMDVWHCQLPVKTRRDHGISPLFASLRIGGRVALRWKSGEKPPP